MAARGQVRCPAWSSVAGSFGNGGDRGVASTDLEIWGLGPALALGVRARLQVRGGASPPCYLPGA